MALEICYYCLAKLCFFWRECSYLPSNHQRRPGNRLRTTGQLKGWQRQWLPSHYMPLFTPESSPGLRYERWWCELFVMKYWSNSCQGPTHWWDHIINRNLVRPGAWGAHLGSCQGGGKVAWVGGLGPWNSQLSITMLVTVVKVKILSQGAMRTWLRPITH